MEFAWESHSFDHVCTQQGSIAIVTGSGSVATTGQQAQEQHQQRQQLKPSFMLWVAVPVQSLVPERSSVADALDLWPMKPSMWSPKQASQHPLQLHVQEQPQVGYSHSDCHDGWGWPNTPECGKFGGRWRESSLASKLASHLSLLLDGDFKQVKEAIDLLREQGMVSSLAFHRTGCRAVQKALDSASVHDVVDLAQDLKGHVLEAIRSPSANYVLQKFITILPMGKAAFIVAEMQGAGIDLPLHEYGCRICCRMLEYQAHDPSFASLMDALLVHTHQLVCHRYGHFVVERALQHGLPHQKQHIFKVLRLNLERFMWDRFAVHVVAKGLTNGEDAERQCLAAQLLAQTSEMVVERVISWQGRELAEALLQQPRCMQEKLAEHLQSPSMQGWLQASRKGKQASRKGKKLREQLCAKLAKGAELAVPRDSALVAMPA